MQYTAQRWVSTDMRNNAPSLGLTSSFLSHPRIAAQACPCFEAWTEWFLLQQETPATLLATLPCVTCYSAAYWGFYGVTPHRLPEVSPAYGVLHLQLSNVNFPVTLFVCPGEKKVSCAGLRCVWGQHTQWSCGCSSASAAHSSCCPLPWIFASLLPLISAWDTNWKLLLPEFLAEVPLSTPRLRLKG